MSEITSHDHGLPLSFNEWIESRILLLTSPCPFIPPIHPHLHGGDGDVHAGVSVGGLSQRQSRGDLNDWLDAQPVPGREGSKAPLSYHHHAHCTCYDSWSSSCSWDSWPTELALWVGLFPTMDYNDILGWANFSFRQNCQQLKSYTLWSVPKFLLSSEFIVGIYSPWLAPPGESGGESSGTQAHLQMVPAQPKEHH